jgi:GTP-binding protein EngB required for normal cell division
MSINITKEKKVISEKLLYLKNKISEVENEFKINLSELTAKIKQSIENVNNDVFSIAFFGAFSDGKSTILSVLIDKLNIDISPEPTTDKIQAYKFKDYQIIDTPGLFSDNLIHDELTRKYISEANIIIYTVGSVNPLKDSHRPTIKWILSDLKKYDSTIFIINKMDEVADLEDDSDFCKNVKIKKEVVSSIIQDIIGFESTDKIICIAADPYEQGLKFWKNNDDYKRLSRIESLESMISDFKTTYKNELIIKAGISVIRDASVKTLSELSSVKVPLVSEVDLLKSQIDEYDNRVKVLEKDINRSYINIKKEFISLREEVLVEIDFVDNMSELCKVMQKRLGQGCYVLQEEIDLIIRKHTGNLLSESKEIFESLEESLIYHSKIQDILLSKLSETGKSVIKGMLSAPTRKIADAVIKTRNILKLPFKFKPWRALKIAKFLKAIPVVMEALQLGTGVWSKYKTDKKKNEIKKELENSFKELIQSLTLDNYTATYFPFVEKTQKVLISLEESKMEIKGTISNIDKICREINIDELGY